MSKRCHKVQSKTNDNLCQGATVICAWLESDYILNIIVTTNKKDVFTIVRYHWFQGDIPRLLDNGMCFIRQPTSGNKKRDCRTLKGNSCLDHDLIIA